LFLLDAHTDPVSSVCFFRKDLWTGSLDGTIRIWSLKAGRCKKILKPANLTKGPLQNPAPIFTLTVRGEYILSSNREGNIHVWNPQTKDYEQLEEIHSDAVVASILIPSSNLVWFASWDKSISVVGIVKEKKTGTPKQRSLVHF
jgi:WD40 repeat protein